MTGSVFAAPGTRCGRPVTADPARRRRRAAVSSYLRHPQWWTAAWRPSIVLLALAPLTMILTWKLTDLTGDRVLGLYGLGVTASLFVVFFLAFAVYTDPARDAAATALTESDLPLVSFLVAVKDEVDGIEACVRSMAASRYPRLEVIVADDGSTDGTDGVLAQLRDELGITVLTMPRNIGKKRALVEAFRRSRGEIVVFTDSDCVVAPDAVELVVRAIVAHPDIGGVSGHARALNADRNLLTRIQDTWYDGQFGVAKAAESCFGGVSCVSGPLAAFRRVAVAPYLPAWAEDRFAGVEFRFATDRQLTGYVLGQYWVGERLRSRHADDPLTAAPAVTAVWRVEYVRSARVATNVPHTPRAFLRQQVRWKKSFVRNLSFTGAFYWRRGLLPTVLFYGHVAWVLLAPVMVARHLVWLPLHGMWLATLLYVIGIFAKGSAWALAYRAQNPRCPRWRYRPLMTLTSSLLLSWLLPYSALTIRRGIWARG